MEIYTVKDICDLIEKEAPVSLQENYDNSGLQVGSVNIQVGGILLCIDITEEVIEEAIQKKCNLIISHHPLIFSGIKKLTGQNYVQRCIIKAIQNNIAIYSAHTNMDNILHGVNGKIAEKIGLINTKILQPRQNTLLKLITFLPDEYVEKVSQALFKAGAGNIGNYDSCSYRMEGLGSFRANETASPFVGNKNELHKEIETRLEVIMPEYRKDTVLSALFSTHPYEEPAYDIIRLENNWNNVGSGIIGELKEEENEEQFLQTIKRIFNLSVIRHTNYLGKNIKKVAVCGGSGSSFLHDAIKEQADIFISGDFKYHEFFDAESKILIADIGHYESEQFTKDIFYEIITKKITTFAIQISQVKTNPINYL